MFQIGERVTVTIVGIPAFERGALGTVVAVDEGRGDSVGVAFDEAIGLHALGGKCPNNHGMWCPFEMTKKYIPSYNRDLRRQRQEELYRKVMLNTILATEYMPYSWTDTGTYSVTSSNEE